jgi:hypothetical protein
VEREDSNAPNFNAQHRMGKKQRDRGMNVRGMETADMRRRLELAQEVRAQEVRAHLFRDGSRYPTPTTLQPFVVRCNW